MITKQTDNKLIVKIMGLNVEVDPYFLIKNNYLSERSSQILDRMIETEYLSLLFWIEEQIEVEGAKEWSERCKENMEPALFDFANFQRNIVPLHSDFEVFTEKMEKDDKETSEWAFSTYKYKEMYGFESTKELA